MEYTLEMKWSVKEHEEYTRWFEMLEEGLQDEILARVGVLSREGPRLGRPQVDTLTGSRYPNMKELRVQYQGEPWRILFAFDPKRNAILLLGGNKTGNSQWYEENLPIADRRFEQHLEVLEQKKEKGKKHGHIRRKDGSSVPRKKGKNRSKKR